MDLREKKTRRAIREAFLKLRKTKPVEKISVKELAQLAEISKATFYLHYRDIFDLSDALQNEVIQSILENITHPEYILTDPAQFTQELTASFYAQAASIEVLFSGNQYAVLPMHIEQELRTFLHKHYPNADCALDMLLTYQIMGSYYVFNQYGKACGKEETMAFLVNVAKLLEQQSHKG